MRCILLSIKPQYVAKILNGEKTIEVRKHAIPVGTKVYIYCTKRIKLYFNIVLGKYMLTKLPTNDLLCFNGKVVASFVVSECEKETNKLRHDILVNACVSYFDLKKYVGNTGTYFAWHISQLKIFDEPKELSDFRKSFNCDYKCYACKYQLVDDGPNCDRQYIRKPPQNFIYVRDID